MFPMASSNEASEKTNLRIIEKINRIEILPEFADFRKVIFDNLNSRIQAGSRCNVIDIGRSLREYSPKVERLVDSYFTADINDLDNVDFLFDLCDASTIPGELNERFSDVVALAILEHTWQPFEAAKNMKNFLDLAENPGRIWIFAPFLYPYHAPKTLVFQDFFRYTRDSYAVLFPDAAKITVSPARGRLETGLHYLLPFYKKYFEIGKLSVVKPFFKFLDKLVFSVRSRQLQASGYNVLIEYDAIH